MANHVIKVVFDDFYGPSAVEAFQEALDKLIFDMQLVVSVQPSEEDFVGECEDA